jgi:hypothetical protein
MRPLVLYVATFCFACGGSGDTPVDAPVAIDAMPDAPPQPVMFHCAKDATCPPVTIGGDPISTDAFHGLGDPSLERDVDGTLWLAYSWLDEQPLGTATIHAVRTHLAKSTDGGATWTFVRAVNAAAPAPNNVALVIHEVSSIARRPDGAWHHTWLTYGQPASGQGVQYHYQRTIGATPEALGDTIDPWLRGPATTLATQLDSSMIPGAEACAVFTEPALFTHGGASYLATTCIVDGTAAKQRMVLLRENGAALAYVGELLTPADALELGGTRVEQIDLSVAKDGTVIALVTPIADTLMPPHRGCVALEVQDIATAKLRRDAQGKLVKRAVITADGNGIGPGLCTYDKDSSTGVLIDIVTVAGENVEFSLRATGVHL